MNKINEKALNNAKIYRGLNLSTIYIIIILGAVIASILRKYNFDFIGILIALFGLRELRKSEGFFDGFIDGYSNATDTIADDIHKSPDEYIDIIKNSKEKPKD